MSCDMGELCREIKHLAPDHFLNTIPALRLVQADRRITAGSQFPRLLARNAQCDLDRGCQVVIERCTKRY